MAVETPTVAAVRVVITTSLDDAAVQSLIDDAAALIDGQCSCIASLPSATQQSIVKWVAAYLISTVKQQGGGTLTSDRLGDAARTYSTTGFGKQLASSAYGQNALLLDPTGCLARLGKARATIEKV